MGYLNNQIITTDSILTKKGRELLARGDGSFRITQFALSDDEIDYSLYNSSHPSGSNYYGEAIENMPLLEAFPDETQVMKYKLVTLPRGTSKMSVISLGQSNLSLNQTEETSITPQTLNYLGRSSTTEPSGYIFTISDVRLFSTFKTENNESEEDGDVFTTYGTNISKSVTGEVLSLKATGVNSIFRSSRSVTTTLTVIGRDSGARIQIPVTINSVDSN